MVAALKTFLTHPKLINLIENIAKGGKVAMYNEGGMIKNTGSLNTGIKKA